MGRGKNAGNRHFLLFQHCFLTYQGEKSSFQQHLFFCLSSPNAFNLDQVKILSFGEDLTNSLFRLKAFAYNQLLVAKTIAFVFGSVKRTLWEKKTITVTRMTEAGT